MLQDVIILERERETVCGSHDVSVWPHRWSHNRMNANEEWKIEENIKQHRIAWRPINDECEWRDQSAIEEIKNNNKNTESCNNQSNQ